MIFISLFSSRKTGELFHRPAGSPKADPDRNSEAAYARAAEFIPDEWAGLDLAVERIRNSAATRFAALLEAPIALLQAVSQKGK